MKKAGLGAPRDFAENGAHETCSAVSSEQTIIGHGVYLIAMALFLFFAPGVLRLVFAFPVEFDWWNRIMALPVFNLGLFCIGCGFLKSRMLIKLTIAMRTLVMVAVAALVTFHIAPPLALGIGIIDMLPQH